MVTGGVAVITAEPVLSSTAYVSTVFSVGEWLSTRPVLSVQPKLILKQSLFSCKILEGDFPSYFNYKVMFIVKVLFQCFSCISFYSWAWWLWSQDTHRWICVWV